MSNAGNADVTFSTSAVQVTGTALTNTQYLSIKTPCEKWSPWKNFRISHTAWFPTPYDGAVAIRQTFENLTGYPVTPTLYNGQFHWPLAPQAHFDRNKFKDNASDRGYWRFRQSNGTWSDLPVDKSPGWLSASRDFYLPSGHAIAVYKDIGRSWGAALYCKQLDYGFYAKDMTSYGIMFMASVWSFSGSIPNNGSVGKTCHVLYGSEAVISSIITNL